MTTDLFRKIFEITSQGKACVLVTVAETEGSGPMSVGKKMLVQDDGSSVGTVGGGALEYEAIEVSKQILKDRQSRLVSYLLQDGAVEEGLKTVPMVCGGRAKLFYEYLSGGESVYIFGGGHVDLSPLYSPVGLDIGGASPPEIALAVAAEISAVKYGKNEIRHMRDL